MSWVVSLNIVDLDCTVLGNNNDGSGRVFCCWRLLLNLKFALSQVNTFDRFG